jgi:glycosyltransferase involved in cell wall biosynthesis
VKLDTHVHTVFSGKSTLKPLHHLLRESYNTVDDVYRLAKARGMDLVAITDHDAIDGALSIADRPDVIVGCEVTGVFADGVRVHLGVLGLSEAQHRDTNLGDYTAVLSGSRRLARMMDIYMRWLYGRCERVLVPSEDTRLRLGELGWTRARLAVWPRGVDAGAFTPDRRSRRLRLQWGVCDKRPAILYAGRLSREKGLTLLQPFASVLHRSGLSHRLIVAGDGPMAGEIRESCPDAMFLGRVPHDDIGRIMASTDLLLFPSDTDTAGNVVLEAQASGIPVLVSSTGGPREQMQDGITGFACRPGDALDFATKATEILGSRERHAEMSAAARGYALTRTWRSALDPLFLAYYDMLAVRHHGDRHDSPLGMPTGAVMRP